ncbi:hypothetical protein [Calycomorphotria hydatis]|uniref:Uncharacterized protein n=1 Tax=Calycomorphotria hydatis TaxID=2528027 RepID=A0A517TAC8_9PLAN|nr:hypothetical protein [Calycomorphotria hydatis]QDT65324.1 hypothetical protein V22_25730 [Calycomorphotria hydatis]
MRNVTIVYSVIAIWAFGWLAGRFGFSPSLFASFIILAPMFFAWRMISRDQSIKRREFAYLGIVTVLAVAASVFIVLKWYDTGMDRRAIFDREYHAFQRHISTMPEYKNVEISYTHRKGGRVYLHGSVANKDSHDRLIQIIDWMIRNNDSGYYDGVEYPGKTKENEAATPNGA